MRSHRSGPIAAVRFLLYMHLWLAGDTKLPGYPWPDEELYLWVCRAAGCRWARFLPEDPSDNDRCMLHGTSHRYQADITDRDKDVQCPTDGCLATKHIDRYDETTDKPQDFRCGDGKHKGSR